MERKTIHPQGPTCSRIIAGAWRWHAISAATVEHLIHTALDQGITTFDHADIYGDHGNEEIFGHVLRKNPALRNKMELVTKCGIKLISAKRPSTQIKHYDTSRAHITGSVENSLKALGTDHIDLLLIHRPDPLLEPHEVAEVFVDLKQQGKVLHFGVSNFTPSQFSLLQSYLPMPLVTNQIEISLTKVDPLFNGDLDALMTRKVSPMAWSPLGGGRLMEQKKTWENVSTAYNASFNQLALAWLLRHPANIFPVIGTTKPERIQECALATAIQLQRQDWFAMLAQATGIEVP